MSQILVLDIVEYVRKDPQGKKLEEVLPEHRIELAALSKLKPWHKSIKDASALIEENLYTINPCMLQLMYLWETTFRFVFCYFRLTLW